MKRVVESCRRLDVRHLQRKGCVSPGGALSVAWQNPAGEQVASIKVQVQPGRVLLHYRSRRQGEDWKDVEEWVPLTWTSCHFGGQRPWFVCPGAVNGPYCGRRVAVLYDASSYFLCRQCCGLAYESQRKDRLRRLVSKAQKIRHRLGGSTSLKEGFPPKPKWMHWRTYERLQRQASAVESVALRAREEEVSGLLKSVEKLTGRLSKAAE